MTITLKILENYAALSRTGADTIAALFASRPTAALVLATGETPMGMYRELAQRRRRGELDASQVRVFQLDEYLGLRQDDRRSLFGWTRRAIIEPLAIPATNVVALPGDAAEPEVACRAYEQAVYAAGGFDLAVLGLGPNGHIGFNEPPAYPDSPARVVALTDASLDSNARYWGGRDQVPQRAMTAGMNQLLAARQILLVVAGQHKHTILHQTVEGPVTPEVPASFLQQVANVTVIADRAAWHGRVEA